MQLKRRKRTARRSLFKDAKRYVNNGKTRFNSELLKAIESHLQDGLPVITTCALVGIREQQYYKWLKQGNEYLRTEDEEDRNPNHVIYAYFVLRVNLAVAKWEKRKNDESLNTKKYKPNWVRDLKLLQIRSPGSWGEQGAYHGGFDDMYNEDEVFL